MTNYTTATNTGSILTYGDQYGTNTTDTAISTNIIITVRGKGGVYVPVGAVQTMQISEKRQVRMVDEVGTDGHIDSVPMKSQLILLVLAKSAFPKVQSGRSF